MAMMRWTWLVCATLVVAEEGNWPSCLEGGVAYTDLMDISDAYAGQHLVQEPNGGYLANAKACQESCKVAPHCKKFTFKTGSFPPGACFLLDATEDLTHRYTEHDAVSGSVSCNFSVVIPSMTPPAGAATEKAAAKTGEAAAGAASTGIAAVDTATSAAETAAAKTGGAAAGVASASREVPIVTPSILSAPAKSKPADVVDDSKWNCLQKGVLFQDSTHAIPFWWTSSPAECQRKCQASHNPKGWCHFWTWKNNTQPPHGCNMFKEFPGRFSVRTRLHDPNATTGAKYCNELEAIPWGWVPANPQNTTKNLTKGPAKSAKSFIAQSPSGMNSNTLWAVCGGVAVFAAVGGVAVFASSSSESKKGRKKRGVKISAQDEESATSIAPSAPSLLPQPGPGPMVAPTPGFQPVMYFQQPQVQPVPQVYYTQVPQ